MKIMEVAELQEKIREVYKLINYQNVEFEWNEQLRQARKILNEIQSKLHQPTVSGAICECSKLPKGEIAISIKALSDPNWTDGQTYR